MGYLLLRRELGRRRCGGATQLPSGLTTVFKGLHPITHCMNALTLTKRVPTHLCNGRSDNLGKRLS